MMDFITQKVLKQGKSEGLSEKERKMAKENRIEFSINFLFIVRYFYKRQQHERLNGTSDIKRLQSTCALKKSPSFKALPRGLFAGTTFDYEIEVEIGHFGDGESFHEREIVMRA